MCVQGAHTHGRPPSLITHHPKNQAIAPTRPPSTQERVQICHFAKNEDLRFYGNIEMCFVNPKSQFFLFSLNLHFCVFLKLSRFRLPPAPRRTAPPPRNLDPTRGPDRRPPACPSSGRAAAARLVGDRDPDDFQSQCGHVISIMCLMFVFDNMY